MNKGVSFKDIVLSPDFLEVTKHLQKLIGKSVWWAVDTAGRRIPLSDESPFCSEADSSAAIRQRCISETLKLLPKVEAEGQIYSAPCSRDHQEIILPFYYLSEIIGFVGICLPEGGLSSRRKNTVEVLESYLRIYSSLLSMYDDLEHVHQIWEQMISARDLDQLLPRILQDALETVNLDRGVLFLVDGDGKLIPQVCNPQQNGQIDYPHHVDLQAMNYQCLFQEPSRPFCELTEDDPLSQWCCDILRGCQISGRKTGRDRGTHVAVPLWRNEQLFALIVAQSPGKKLHLQRQTYMLHLVTDGAAAVLESALNLHRMKKRSLALSTIHTIHRLMSSNLSAEELMQQIARLATQLLGGQKCSVMMVDHERGILVPTARIGLKRSETGTHQLKPGKEIPGYVYESFEPLIVHYPYSDPLFADDSRQAYPDKSYLSVPMIDLDIEGVITVSARETPFTPADREILMTLAEQAVIALGNARLIDQQKQMVLRSLRSIANVIETHDPFANGTAKRIEELAYSIGKRIREDASWLLNLRFASLIHDAGQIGLQASIPSPRYDASDNGSQSELQQHLNISTAIARSIQLDSEVVDMIEFHHENYDGSGFPQGLKGREIPLGARIIALADAYVTLENKGRAGKSYPKEQIIAILRKMAGKRFDPELVEALRETVFDYGREVAN